MYERINPRESHHPDEPTDNTWTFDDTYTSHVEITAPDEPWEVPRCTPTIVAADHNAAIEAAVWIPDGAPSYDTDHPETDIIIGSERHSVSTRLLQMADTFNQTDETRVILNHDCAVFALACESGDPYTDVAFHPQGLRIEHMVEYFPVDLDEAIALAEQTEPGTIIHMSGITDEEERAAEGVDLEADSSSHYMIKATGDTQGAPLFFSKYGLNPVGLSTMQDALRIYPAKRIGIAHGLRTWTYNQDKQ